MLREIKSAAEMFSSGRFGKKAVSVVYGNCQADALRRTLMLAPDFRAKYVAVKIPPVHLISDTQIRPLRMLLERADLFITQPIRDDLRDMPIGTEQVSKYLHETVTVMTYPSMYFDGFHPYQVTVHAPGADLSTPAPITDYHDLRFMFAAANGWDLSKAQKWLEAFTPSAEYVRGVYKESMETLEGREALLDAKVTPGIRANGGRSFFTLNHPSNAILRSVAEQIFDRLGVDSTAASAPTEYLSILQAPVETSVSDALKVDPGAESAEWSVRGERVSQSRILAAHLEWYLSRPEALQAGLAKHAVRMASAGLAV